MICVGEGVEDVVRLHGPPQDDQPFWAPILAQLTNRAFRSGRPDLGFFHRKGQPTHMVEDVSEQVECHVRDCARHYYCQIVQVREYAD